MTLLQEERNAIVRYRIGRAGEALREARDNFALGHYNLVANRLYYAVFYVCSALLISRGIVANTHSGVMAMINMNFVKTGELSEDEKQLISQLFMMRQSGDYDDIFDWTKEDVESKIEPTERFVKHLSELARKDYI